MGTDFSFEDLTERTADEDTHELVATKELDGALHHVVVSRPNRSDSPYRKRIHWVDPRSWTLARIEFYGVEDRHVKTLVTNWKLQDGVWVATLFDMTNHENGHRTLIEVSETTVDSDLDEELFTPDRLERGGR